MHQLFKTIIFSIAAALPFWLAARSIIYFLRRKRSAPASLKREIVLAAFFVYLVFLAALTVIPLKMTSAGNSNFDDLNLVPLVNSFKCFVPGAMEKPKIMLVCIENIIGNIILFVPFGVLLPLVARRFDSFGRVLLAAGCLSLGIETIQFFSRFIGNFRVVDVDDIIFNTLGAALGYLLFAVAGATGER